jgi:nephrocystin-3
LLSEADTLDNIASMWYNRKEYEKADFFYTEALKLKRRINSPISKDLLSLSNTLNNYAVFLAEKNDYDKSKSFHIEALNIRINLQSIDFQYSSYVATTLCNMANLCLKLKLFKEAKNNYEEALIIRRELAKINQSHLLQLGITLKNMAIFYFYDDVNIEKAFGLINEAITIFRKKEQINISKDYLDIANKVRAKIIIQKTFDNQTKQPEH